MHLIIVNILALGVCILPDHSHAVFNVDTTKFASRSTYRSSSTDEERQNATSTLNTINSYCKPLQVSAVLRHGTRNLNTAEITSINGTLNKFKAAGLNQTALQQLQNIVEQFPSSKQSALVQNGILEHQGIGFRMVDLFRDLFSTVDVNELLFSSTTPPRAGDSCKAFQTGFFSQHNRTVTAPNCVTRDDILRFFDNCDKYTKLQSNASSLIEYTTFLSNTFPAISKNYADDLGTSATLSNDDMASVYMMGAMEFAVLNSTIWAQHINPQDMLTLEYSNDLQTYYQLGYGYPINYQMSCPLLSTIFRGMDSVYNGSKYQKGAFYFAHSETVAPLFDIIGLYKDSVRLTASNFDQQSNRQFRTGKILPFAANIALVQYSCDVPSIMANIGQISGGIFPTQPQRNMTLMLVNEAPIKFPSCDAFLCPYATVRSFYSDQIDKCNYDITCEKNQPSTTQPPTTKKQPSAGMSVHSNICRYSLHWVALLFYMYNSLRTAFTQYFAI